MGNFFNDDNFLIILIVIIIIILLIAALFGGIGGCSKDLSQENEDGLGFISDDFQEMTEGELD